MVGRVARGDHLYQFLGCYQPEAATGANGSGKRRSPHLLPAPSKRRMQAQMGVAQIDAEAQRAAGEGDNNKKLFSVAEVHSEG